MAERTNLTAEEARRVDEAIGIDWGVRARRRREKRQSRRSGAVTGFVPDGPGRDRSDPCYRPDSDYKPDEGEENALCDPRGGQVRYLIHFSEGGRGMRTLDEAVEPGAQTYDRSVAVEKGNVLVRRATVEDAVAVTALHGDLHRMHTEAHPDIFTVFDPTLTRPRFERLLADDDALIWIAESEGEPVGFVSATLKHQEASDTVREDRALHVHELAVAPQARRAGVGRALMQGVEDCARSLRLMSVSLNTWLFNTEARDFYERLGYQRLNMQMRRRL